MKCNFRHYIEHLNPNVHESDADVLESKQTKLDFGLWINLEKSLKWNLSHVNDIVHRMFRAFHTFVPVFAISPISVRKYDQIWKINSNVDASAAANEASQYDD